MIPSASALVLLMSNGLIHESDGWIGAGRSREVHLDERHEREDAQDDHLGAEQEPLRLGRRLDADVADPGHDHDPEHAEGERPPLAVREAVGAEQVERVLAGDLGQVRHHDHVGGDDAPAAHPAQVRPHRPRHPREGGAAVGVGPVQVVVGRGDEEHRHEREQHDRRRLQADDGHDEPEAGREAVAGRGRRDADDDARDEAERPGLQPLLARVVLERVDGRRHVIPRSELRRDHTAGHGGHSMTAATSRRHAGAATPAGTRA